MAATPTGGGLRRFHSRPWLQTFNFRTPASSLSTLASSCFSPSSSIPSSEPEELTTTAAKPKASENNSQKAMSYFPKRGQTLELVCESLAFKGKGVCKVADTGFIVMCERALPGEKFVGRVTRRKDNYAEVKKVETIFPHWDFVEAPCEYASHCGGCKTQNLLYEAQVRYKEQQVHELIVHVGKFLDKDPEGVMKPIVPCDIQFHYRNKMEFSFGTRKWLPPELLQSESDENNEYALGLHAPGFFDKVLNINKCLLQSDPANRLFKIVGEIHSLVSLHMMCTLMVAF